MRDIIGDTEIQEDMTTYATKKYVRDEVNSLAAVVASGFDRIEQRFTDMNKRMDHLQAAMSSQFNALNNRMDHFSLNCVTHDDLKRFGRDLENRLEKRLEKKIVGKLSKLISKRLG
jgi:hypothetical protein